MNCEHCHELLSLYLDSELQEPSSSMVREHLSRCAECAAVCEDLAAIIDTAGLDEAARTTDIASAAMWKNITDSIADGSSASELGERAPKRRRGLDRIWHLTLPQAVASIAATVIVTSLLTFVALSGWMSPATVPADAASERSLFEKMLARTGLVDSPEEQLRKRLEERRRAIDFWNRRIEARRVQWDGRFRDTFDRNLNEIEQVVNEYSRALEENPDDTLTGEMLDSALYDKEELLRAFSEL